MYTRKEIDEIAQALEARGKKDTQFPLVEGLDGSEEFAIVQNKTNRRTSINTVITFFSGQIITPVLDALDVMEKDILQDIDDLDKKVASEILQSQEVISANINETEDSLSKAVQDCQTAILAAIGNISFDNVEEELIDAINNSTQSILNDISALYTQLHGNLVEVESSLSQSITNSQDKVLESIETLSSNINGYFQSLESSLENWIGEQFASLKAAVINSIEEESSTIQTLVTQTVSQAESQLKAKMDEMLSALNTSIQTVYNNILTRFNSVEENILEGISDTREDIASSTKKIQDTVIDSQNMTADILSAYNQSVQDNLKISNAEVLAKVDTVNAYWKAWENRECVLIVSTQVPDAVITLNNAVQSTITVPVGYAVNIRITAAGYKTFNEIVPIFRNQSINIVLEPVETSDTCTVKVVTTPSDAVITMNSITGAEQTFTKNTEVNISVSKTHYITRSFTVTVTEDMIFEVNLIGEDTDFTITPVPSDSIVVINGLVRSSAVLPYGTSVDWEVSHKGYVTKTGTTLLTEDTVLPVTLDKDTFTVTLQAVPENAVIKINEAVQSSITAAYGTEFTYEVSADGYVTASGTLTVEKTETVTIVLEKTYVIIIEGQLLYDSQGGTKTARIKSNTGWIFK